MSNESNHPYEAPNPVEEPVPAPAEPTAKPDLPRHRPQSSLLLVLMGAVAGLVVGIGSTLAVGGLDFSGSPFEAAVENCGIREGVSVLIGDDGASLNLDHQGAEESSGISLDSLVCILEELEAPDSVVAEMSQTRALDGRQSADWDGIHASWSYHPDSGLDIVLSLD